MKADEVQLQISGASQERIAIWAGRELRSHALHGVVAALLFAALALIANAAVFAAILISIFEFFPRRASGDAVTLAALIALGLTAAMYPVYILWHRPRTILVRLSSGSVRIPCDRHETVALVPNEESSELNTFRWRCDFLLFPAWLSHMALNQALNIVRAWKADEIAIGRLFATLLIVHRRIDLSELDSQMTGQELPKALSAVRHFPGVQFWHRNEVSISLGQDLRKTIATMV